MQNENESSGFEPCAALTNCTAIEFEPSWI